MGPRARYHGKDVPAEILSWQDPVPAHEGAKLSDKDVAALKAEVLKSGISVPTLVRTAWASAASYRDSDMRGGANGARVALAPQNSWAVNNPDELNGALKTLKGIQAKFNKKAKAKVSSRT